MPDSVDGEAKGAKLHLGKSLPVLDLKKMPPTQRSKYMAYCTPSKHVLDAQRQTKLRLQDASRVRSLQKESAAERQERLEREKYTRLIGQLKAAEARNRLRILRLRYKANRAQEIGHLIACQSAALKAVRLQVLLPPYPEPRHIKDTLDKLDRVRVEALIEDMSGLYTNPNY